MYPRSSGGRPAPYTPPPEPRGAHGSHPSVAVDNRVDMLRPYKWEPAPDISPRRPRFMPTPTLGHKRRFANRSPHTVKRQCINSNPQLPMGSPDLSGHGEVVAGSSGFPTAQPHRSPQPVLELPLKPPFIQALEEYVKDKLSRQMMGMFVACHQQPPDFLRKEAMRALLHRDISVYYPGARLFLTGSSLNGLGSRTSDADLCLLLEGSRAPLHVLDVLLRLFIWLPYIQHVVLVRAKVPILKFKERGGDLEFDLNVNNTVGIRNTFLMRSYANADPRVGPIVLVVKKWARYHQINDASQGTLSSYSLVLMVLNFLQTRQTPVIPSLQRDHPQCFNPNMPIDGVPEAADKVPRYLSGNKACLGELFLGFLKYYATEFRWDKQVISVREACVFDKTDSLQWKNKYICVEEPFDRTNVARAVHKEDKFKAIKDQFFESWCTLQREKDLNSILPVQALIAEDNCKR
ncbi:poly(A) RNA polymerase GLD2 isoform 1-T2 [Synchiropus picturatus]